MEKPAFRPLGDRYLVLPNPVEEKVEDLGEYQITEKKDEHEKPSEGIVIVAGNKCTELEPGAIVFYGKYSGYEQDFDGKTYLVLRESEILGERLIAA